MSIERMHRAIVFLLFCTLFLMENIYSSELLTPVKTDNPRDTMRTFMQAMNDYKKGMEIKSGALIEKIDIAIRCLNLADTPFLLRKDTGKEAAIFLKEVIDRIIVIDYSKIPEGVKPQKGVKGALPLLRWRLKGSEIVIGMVTKGERAGEYLFTKETTYRAKEFYQKVKKIRYQKGSGGGALYKEPWVEKIIPKWSKETFFVLNLWQWIGLFIAILLGLALKTIIHYLIALLNKLAGRSTTDWDNKIITAISSPVGYLAASGLWFVSFHVLRLEGKALNMLSMAIQIFFSVIIIWLIHRLMAVFSDYLKHLSSKTESTLDDQLVPLINKTIKIIVMIFAVLVAIQNLGINVMSVLAGLGIGGLAFALAAKDTVANLFGSFMILLDRPFQVGDWVIIGSAEGTVQEIGFRSTRLQTFYDSVISIPNSELANTKIDNMGMREFRRVKHFIGVTYDTPSVKMEAFLEGIKNIIKANPYTRKDYFHVVFNRFGPSSLDIMLYFFLKVADWSTELVERQNVFLEIMRLGEALEIEFAFPTQTLHMETFPEKKPVRGSHNVDRQFLGEGARDFGRGGNKSQPGGSGLFIPPHKEMGKP